MLGSHLETIAVACCFINIYLVAREHILNFLFGSIAVVLYFIIFLNAKLYADMCLQLVFFALQFYTCYQWLSGRKISSPPIRLFSPILLTYSALFAVVLFAMVVFILSRYTDSTTIYMDAAITVLSLVAQWMMSKKWLAHWWLWMIVDLLSIQVYLLKGLYSTSILYAVLFLLCIYGYFNWQKQMTLPRVHDNLKGTLGSECNM